MPSGSKSTNNSFSGDWLKDYVRDREQLSWKRLAIEFQCTYLNRRTLDSVQSILDAGCGGAFLLKYLNDHAPRVSYLGIDRSSACISEAQRRFPGNSFLISDHSELPFTVDAFDVAYSRDVVIHHPAPYEAIAELYRVASAILLRVLTHVCNINLQQPTQNGRLLNDSLMLKERCKCREIDYRVADSNCLLFDRKCGLEQRGDERLFRLVDRQQITSLFLQRSNGIPSTLRQWLASFISKQSYFRCFARSRNHVLNTSGE